MTKEAMTFEESMMALEVIVKELEQGEVPLETALEQFQKGIELSKICQETLTKAEKTLTKIMTENDEEVVFDESES
ncbi:exodeoxyribonuclease VII small subunit [Vagococcus sp. BWB3-3]|uniref:Exodeoxyribonuclease 7 small subunit n=1 Tax=Vagococcus allomyrinae TaxID=2794353 RepID=A0A940P5Q1_9ENTE|nr:exodeoxyribonuclease VII small subunit [Vagococcus allomyrinae]MBP1041510.1 exodeoxyribonuclease VII small subunit [Vagococcus allomyrinae]